MSIPTRKDSDFDPRTVPVFPRIAMEIDTAQRTITVDGAPCPVEADDDLFDTAIAAAAARIASRKLAHARVAAVVDQDRYTLVVGADGSRHSLDDRNERNPKRRTSRGAAGHADRPLWPLFAGAAVLVLILSTVVGVSIALHQRATAVQAPTAPTTPPQAELPIVPTDAWTTHAAWAVPLGTTSNRASVLLTKTSLITIAPGDVLTALDPATGIEQWSTPVPGSINTGPVRTTIDDQPVVAVVTNDALLWWPETGSPTPAGRVELDTDEDVTFTGSSPLIAGRGQLARIVVAGQPHPRTIPAGATPLRADGDTVLAVNSLGQLWTLNSDDTYVPKPDQLRAPEGADGSVSVVGTSGSVIALRWSIDGGASQIRLYDLNGERIGKAIPDQAQSRWDAAPDGPWAIAGSVLINTTTGDHSVINNEDWRTLAIGPQIYGRAGQTTVLLDPATGEVRPETNRDATPPLTSTPSHAFYAADDNDGEPRLYAVTPSGQ